jgi:exodeoxyribonuclease V alpha subunit
MIRVRAGISYALTEAMDEGHCGLPTGELTPLAEKLLEVSQDLIRTLAESQRVAVGTALTSKVLLITGGPGVGKTTIINTILRILSAKGAKFLLCAPKGRGAKRMNEATGLEAKTCSEPCASALL